MCNVAAPVLASLITVLGWSTAGFAQPKAAEPRAAEPRAAEPKAAEPRAAEPRAAEPRAVFGIAARGGGRFDNVRMCVASAAGAKGGPAMDIAFVVEIPLKRNLSLSINIPVMRPILFGASFDMLQAELEVTLAFRIVLGRKVDLIVGPSFGLILHYGPDYRSESSGDGRGPSFFALGPHFGGYLGLDFKRPGKVFNFQVGIHPYVAPMFAVDDPDEHRGVVVGGTLDALFRFSWYRR